MRGLFQARLIQTIDEFLRKNQRTFATEVALVAGTSTGAITAGALAAGKSADLIPTLFNLSGKDIFTRQRRLFGPLTRASAYSPAALKKVLDSVIGSKNIKDCVSPHLLITATSLTFQHAVFSSIDKTGLSVVSNDEATVVDAIIASCAAPTYFPSHAPTGIPQRYVDGGLWCNDPSLTALAVAKGSGVAHSRDIKVMSIGTGKRPKGTDPNDYNAFNAIEHARHTIDLMFASQESSASDILKQFLSPNNFVSLNADLPRTIDLDDVTNSIAVLPGLAQDCFGANRDAIERFFDIAPADPKK